MLFWPGAELAANTHAGECVESVRYQEGFEAFHIFFENQNEVESSTFILEITGFASETPVWDAIFLCEERLEGVCNCLYVRSGGDWLAKK